MSEHTEAALVQNGLREIGAAESVDARLRGTVWEHLGFAHVCHRALIAVGQAIGRTDVSANALTIASLVPAAGAAIAASEGLFGWAAVLVIASGVLDVFDGVVARATGTVSRFGALLDSTVDRLSDGLPLLGIALHYGKDGPFAALPIVTLLGGFTVSYIRARAEGLAVELPALFMRRPERVVLLVLSLALGTLSLGTRIDAPLLIAGLLLMALLNVAGAIAALRAARYASAIGANDGPAAVTRARTPATSRRA